MGRALGVGVVGLVPVQQWDTIRHMRDVHYR